MREKSSEIEKVNNVVKTKASWPVLFVRQCRPLAVVGVH